jgi:integrase
MAEDAPRGGSRYGITQALRQALDAAVRWKRSSENPAKAAGKNPQPKLPELKPFTPVEVDAVATELGPWDPLVRFAAGTGLRSSEWIPLEWSDIDRVDYTVTVARSFTSGRLKPHGKTARSRRRVPASSAALAALGEIPRRLNSPLVFPAPGGGGGVGSGHGGYLNLHNWRAREWNPALDAAGINIFELARYMGSSVKMIDKTYGHLAQGSEEAARHRLDSFNTERSGAEVASTPYEP